MLLRYYLLVLSLLALTLVGRSQGIATSQVDPTFFIGLHGGIQENFITTRNTKSYVGVSAELRTDLGFTIRSLIVGSAEEGKRFRRSEFSEILDPDKLLQISLEIGPSIHIANFGRSVEWRIGGGLLVSYSEANWTSRVEVINSTNETILTTGQNSALKLSPLAESNFLVCLSDNWNVSVSGSFGIYIAGRRESIRSFSTGNSRVTEFSDMDPKTGYARAGIGVMYRLGAKGSL